MYKSKFKEDKIAEYDYIFSLNEINKIVSMFNKDNKKPLSVQNNTNLESKKFKFKMRDKFSDKNAEIIISGKSSNEIKFSIDDMSNQRYESLIKILEGF